MKSYLGLVREYGKEHRRQNRLTVICIAISVMLVTAIFGMADMSIQAETDAAIRQAGHYHAIINGITDSVAEQIADREEIKVSGWIGRPADVSYKGKTLAISGGGQEICEEMNLIINQGRYPETSREALIDSAAMEQFSLSIGDLIEIVYEDGVQRSYILTGTFGNMASLKAGDNHGLMLTIEGLRELAAYEYIEYFYIQFKQGVNIRQELQSIQSDYGLAEEQINTNVRLLGLMGQSDESYMVSIYFVAGILFILVTLAGTFMIAGSFNMSVLERTQFFGLLRCLGASKVQVRRYIRLEGLLFSLKGIPIGLAAGSGIMWGALSVLNRLNSPYLAQMPALRISLPGIAAGGLIGFLVVMLAVRTPARKAAAVSPQAAVTGNIGPVGQNRLHRSANIKWLRVDQAMGISHAFANKKSLFLITGSFSFSIILLLSFSVLIGFMIHGLRPLKPYAPDISLLGPANEDGLDRSLMEELKKLPNIKNLYGRMFLYDVPAAIRQQEGTAVLISYDQPQFAWAEDMLVDGQIEAVRKGLSGLVTYDNAQENNWQTGDSVRLTIAGEPCTIEIAGILSDTPFVTEGGEWQIICSEETFTAMTGQSDYTMIDLQVERVAQELPEQIRRLLPADARLLDRQESNGHVRATFYAMAVFVYGFLAVIALVAMINIINTINSSVTGRMGHYGMMRAVGMSVSQMIRMVIAEASVYALSGSVAGAVLGLPLHKLLFETLITDRVGEAWSLPIALLTMIILAALMTTWAAVAPSLRKIRQISIVDAMLLFTAKL